MAVDSLNSNQSAARAQANAQPAQSERAAESASKASDKKVTKADGADQRIEATAGSRAQKVAPSTENNKSDRPKQAEKKESRPVVSDAISSAISRQAIKKSEDTPAPERRAEATQKVKDDQREQVEERASEDTDRPVAKDGAKRNERVDF